MMATAVMAQGVEWTGYFRLGKRSLYSLYSVQNTDAKNPKAKSVINAENESTYKTTMMKTRKSKSTHSGYSAFLSRKRSLYMNRIMYAKIKTSISQEITVANVMLLGAMFSSMSMSKKLPFSNHLGADRKGFPDEFRFRLKELMG